MVIRTGAPFGLPELEVSEQDVDYPVAIDNDYDMWKAYKNRYWPAHYFIDVRGNIRYQHFGEGGYAETEARIQQLLRSR